MLEEDLRDCVERGQEATEAEQEVLIIMGSPTKAREEATFRI